ncbi:MAG: MarR family transcriptional regulator [Deltaproteobacteria bacterium]|nr:MarR family transcriptional regulator [Deltaproteobacteria bacterium]
MTSAEKLFDEVRLLWHALVKSGEEIHADGTISPGIRAVLEHVERHGPASVPHIARARRVTRQHIQGLVNDLVASGLARIEDNPVHRRSGLVRSTDAGTAALTKMRRREAEFLASRGLNVNSAKIERAAKTLRRVRERLEATA